MRPNMHMTGVLSSVTSKRPGRVSHVPHPYGCLEPGSGDVHGPIPAARCALARCRPRRFRNCGGHVGYGGTSASRSSNCCLRQARAETSTSSSKSAWSATAPPARRAPLDLGRLPPVQDRELRRDTRELRRSRREHLRDYPGSRGQRLHSPLRRGPLRRLVVSTGGCVDARSFHGPRRLSSAGATCDCARAAVHRRRVFDLGGAACA